MIITDYNKIKTVKALLPELEGKEEMMISRFNKLKTDKEELWRLRQEVNKFAERIEKDEREYNDLKQFFDFEFETKEINKIQNEVNMQIINDSDYRNHD